MQQGWMSEWSKQAVLNLQRGPSVVRALFDSFRNPPTWAHWTTSRSATKEKVLFESLLLSYKQIHREQQNQSKDITAVWSLRRHCLLAIRIHRKLTNFDKLNCRIGFDSCWLCCWEPQNLRHWQWLELWSRAPPQQQIWQKEGRRCKGCFLRRPIRMVLQFSSAVFSSLVPSNSIFPLNINKWRMQMADHIGSTGSLCKRTCRAVKLKGSFLKRPLNRVNCTAK